LYKLTAVLAAQPSWQTVCDALASNTTLTSLSLNSNRLLPAGTRSVCKALLSCTSLRHLGFSFNEPGVEPALWDLLRAHEALVSVELVEVHERHLPSKAKDEIGRALLANKAGKLGFCHCDVFTLGEETTSLHWPKEASTSDAMLLAGACSRPTRSSRPMGPHPSPPP
jgi:hypothetical protein